MNKKIYTKPALEVYDVEPIEMLAMSFIDEWVDTSEEDVQLTHGRRGRWGNLWDKGDQE